MCMIDLLFLHISNTISKTKDRFFFEDFTITCLFVYGLRFDRNKYINK